MTTPEQIVLMAAYNAHMNRQLYAAAARLPHAELAADRQAFFGSILGTLNHLLSGDTIWLKRFAAHASRPAALAPMDDVAAPSGLAHSFGDDLPALLVQRLHRDAVITQWAAGIDARICCCRWNTAARGATCTARISAPSSSTSSTTRPTIAARSAPC
jgi:hypothetical protein